MSLLSDALAIHRSALQGAAGEPVTYVRGATRLHGITAVPGQTIEENDAGGEAITQVKTTDFLIDPKDLTIASEYIEPQHGDQIITQDGRVYDVNPGSAGMAWEYSDSRRTFYRIHTTYRRK